ncbi:sigma 54-interacting transcriptional regulator [Thermovenabulum gondwanense]|uniref:sigma 54-interacting transcriptional regulator n=1 Tax=Thermovenabulum gondwanense TaxID=520767 RepID=UPI00316AE4BC
MIAVDKEGNVTHINKTAEKILKISKDKIIDKNINLVIPSEPIVEIIKDNIVYKDREFHIQTVDGNMIHCYISINPIVESEKDNILGAIVSVKDGRDMRKFISNIIGSYDKEVRFSDIIGESKVMVNVKQQAIRAAESFSTVLIYGESGTGKELFARAIHSESPMRKGPFIAINCAAIPETLLESELFGYEGGAFSGAKKEGKPGKFELADGGTIFLDEIGDMSLYLQAKLLRVLQDKSPLLKRIFSFENFFMERRNFKIFTEYI